MAGEEQAWLRGSLTLWDLDGSTAEAPEQVGNNVVFDLILGEPGEHREQPKQHGFDLGRGTSGEKRVYFPSVLLSLGASWGEIMISCCWLSIHLKFVQNLVSTHTVLCAGALRRKGRAFS